MQDLAARVRRNLEGFERREHSTEGLRSAAVALPLLPDADGTPCFLITRRAAKLNRHAGQFAFPGGRVEPNETLVQAALREMHEEVGLALEEKHVLGLLDDYTTRSGYVMSPVVVMCEEYAALKPDPSEVASAHLVPLTALDHPDVPRLRRIEQSSRPVLSIPLDHALGVAIHAPTAALLFQLREVALHGRHTRVAHYDAPVFAWS